MGTSPIKKENVIYGNVETKERVMEICPTSHTHCKVRNKILSNILFGARFTKHVKGFSS